jgi:raffinose/stachyose/melibiose transport system permease protein
VRQRSTVTAPRSEHQAARTPVAPVRSWRTRREPRASGLLFAGPALALYVVFTLVPFGYAVYLSFFNWSGVGPLQFVGFSNYVALWQQPAIAASFLHAAILVLFFAGLPVVIALGLTALMTHAPIRGLAVYRTLLFLPQIVALVAVAAVWDWILGSGGPVNTFLRAVGLHALAVNWLGSFTWTLPAVGIIGGWVGYGFAMVVFMAGVQKIPRSLYEAARIDGAGAIREFFVVTLPGLRNEFTVVLVLTITGALTTFDIVYILTGGGPGTSTTVPAYSVYNLAFSEDQVGAAAAVGVVLSLIVFAVALIVLRLSRSEEERAHAR